MSGIIQVPSSREGAFSRCEYKRIIRMNFSDVAGSQFASLSLSGDSYGSALVLCGGRHRRQGPTQHDSGE